MGVKLYFDWTNSAPNDKIHFRFDLRIKVMGQNVNIQFYVNQGGTNRNRFTQILVILILSEPGNKNIKFYMIFLFLIVLLLTVTFPAVFGNTESC